VGQVRRRENESEERDPGIVRALGRQMTDPASVGGEQATHWPEYLSYLLRLCQVSVEGRPAWRVSLQRPGTAEQRVFADLDELLAFLRAQTGESDKRLTTDGEAPM